MKNLFFLSIAFFLLSAQSFASEALEMTNCKWESYFKYPSNGKSFQKGDDVYVLVKPKYGNQDIVSMEMYLNGHYIRKESSYPYEWARSNSGGDHKLRNMQPGTYKLKCKIKTRCGYYKYIYCTFYVKGHPGGGNNNCHFQNPLHDLPWLKHIKNSHSDYKICQYKKNGKIYFKVTKCNSSYTKWYDCHGQTCHVSGAHFVKCWCNPCGGHTNTCKWNSWFEKCKPYFKNHGYDLYVKIGTQKYQDIAYMELYINGQYVRKETNSPYEWGRPYSGGDHKLRNLQVGKTYYVKCRIKDRCGKWHEIKKTVKYHHGS